MLVKYADSISAQEANGSLASGGRAYVPGSGLEMKSIQRLIAEIAPTDIPVLLEGESGTGKEITALQIHALSKYRERPFFKLSCAAFSPVAFQAQLQDFESSGGAETAGTVFFDEISDLDAHCQRHLLHSFPESDRSPGNMPLAGRIVSCTTHDLESEAHAGRFRSELFYRLNGVRLCLPPLRQRREDIPALTEFFLAKYARLFNRAPMAITEPGRRLLLEYAWPGNIRELENVIKKMVAVENEELALTDLRVRATPAPRVASPAIAARSLKAASRAASRQAERELILQTLERTHWNRKRAAEALQISYKALLYKLKQIRIPEPGEL